MAGNPVDTAYSDAVAITPSDSAVYAPPLRALYIGSIGGGTTLTVVTAGGSTVEFVAVVAGMFIPLNVAQVKATGTLASDIVGLK